MVPVLMIFVYGAWGRLRNPANTRLHPSSSGGCVRVADHDIARMIWLYSIVGVTKVYVYGQYPWTK